MFLYTTNFYFKTCLKGEKKFYYRSTLLLYGIIGIVGYTKSKCVKVLIIFLPLFLIEIFALFIYRILRLNKKNNAI